MLSWHVCTIVIGYILLVYINYTFCYCNQEMKVVLKRQFCVFVYMCMHACVHACVCMRACMCVCACLCVCVES